MRHHWLFIFCKSQTATYTFHALWMTIAIRVCKLCEKYMQWTATLSETINLISSIPNHNDDGIINASIASRQVTGILVTGTADNPVIYATSSDPRASVSLDVNLDTNSGILSRLTFDGSSWSKVDLIRGLPRSEELHSTNGLALSPDGTKLYIAQGGNTDNGAPSQLFSYLPEYALAAAILEVDLTALIKFLIKFGHTATESRAFTNMICRPLTIRRFQTTAPLEMRRPLVLMWEAPSVATMG